MRLFPYQREIADAMSDPEIEKITLVKASRIGFTALITAAIGSYIANDPAQALVVLPTESTPAISQFQTWSRPLPRRLCCAMP